MKLTPEQTKILNDAIMNISLLCKAHEGCVECPMNPNCNEYPGNWITIDSDEDMKGRIVPDPKDGWRYEE